MAERNQIRNLIVEYVASFYAKKKSIPSVRQIVRKFTPNVNRGNIYQLFPGGMKQVCQEANVPLPDRVSQTFEAQRIKTARKEQPRTNDFEPEVYGEDLLGLQRVLGSDSVREALKTARKICSRLSPYAEHYEVKDPLKAIDIMKAGFEHKIGELEGLAQTQTQRAVRAETRAEKAEGKVASLCEGDPEQRMLAA
ncbi:TusE/DsrC/DsvC family sulfur relay protein [Candidatus Bathyarchaeota archaeon]|nr:TusE/DsrC/DsvC family sulfur relay protein [Candidatus Bathyarchaeota archaeon]